MKLILSTKEYNTLVGALTQNIDDTEESSNKETAQITKEKLLKFGIPSKTVSNEVEIALHLYLNEIAEILAQLLFYISKRTNEIDYYQALLKVRESFAEQNGE